jgi:hypothetical protein
MKLNSFKRELLRKEFPFLSKIEKWTVTDKIDIRRVDEKLLDFTPWTDRYSWSGGGYSNFEKMCAISDGEIIYLDTADTWATASGRHGSAAAQTVGEQLRARGLTPDYIVTIEQSDYDANGDGERTVTITIYKNRRTVQTAYERKQLKKAYVEIAARLNA